MKLVFIGNLGHNGYVRVALKNMPEIEVPGVFSSCGESLDNMLFELKEAGKSPKIYDDYQTMLSECQPDIVCIDGEFHRHGEMCLYVLKNTKANIFCEKLICQTLEELDEIRTLLDNEPKRKLVAMMGLRYKDAFYTAFEAVRAGKIGKVKLVNTRKSYRFGKRRPDFYKSRALYGGTIGWVGSHAIDWIYWFGGASFKSIWACQNSEDNFNMGEMEVTAQCQFELENGVLGSASIDFLRPEAAPTHGDDRVRVVGTKGIVEVYFDKVEFLGDNGYEELPLMKCPNIFVEFCDSITKNIKPLLTTDDTIAVTEAAILAQKSADEHSGIELK